MGGPQVTYWIVQYIYTIQKRRQNRRGSRKLTKSRPTDRPTDLSHMMQQDEIFSTVYYLPMYDQSHEIFFFLLLSNFVATFS